jgi:hypothetical protein
MPSRQEVYHAIDTERDYQDTLPPNRTDGEPRTVGDYITMLQYYQAQLVAGWTMSTGNDVALQIMRKIAGIAVHCMEDHGAPERLELAKTVFSQFAEMFGGETTL